MLVEISADLGRNRKPRRDRKTDPRHLRKVRAFAAEQRLHAPVAVSLAAGEKVNVFRRFSLSRDRVEAAARNFSGDLLFCGHDSLKSRRAIWADAKLSPPIEVSTRAGFGRARLSRAVLA